MLPEERYKLVRVLGQGGMGTVYEAEDRRLPGKRWAVKEIRAGELGREGMVKEAATLIQLSHPNLPHIADYFTSKDGACGYLVMEQVDGVTLEQHFEMKKKRLSTEEVVQYAIQLCEVLAYLHELSPAPIIHRDLKPANMLVDANKRIVLIDFGTARRYQPRAVKDTIQMGTIGFAAPEQLVNGQTDPRTDLYALGAILYYLLSGGVYPMTTSASIEETLGHVPKPLLAVIDRLLRTDREERYSTARKVKEALLVAMRENERARDTAFMDIERAYTKQRLLVLLSLYAGAGSTMIGLSLSAMLRKANIAHTYMEHPAAEPVLFEWLDPKSEKSMLTNWLLNDNADDELSCDGKSLLKLLFNQDTPVLIVDASHAWDHETVYDLLELADEIVITAGPRFMAYSRSEIIRRIELMHDWAEEGRNLSLMWNGSPKGMKPPELIREIPFASIVSLPYEETIIRWEWSCKPDFIMREENQQAWHGALERWLMRKLEEWGMPIVRKRKPFLFRNRRKIRG